MARASGSVERLPSGRWSIRLTVEGKTKRLRGTYETDAAALAMKDKLVERLAAEDLVAPDGFTLSSYWPRWCDQLELDGREGVAKVRGFFEQYVDRAPLGATRLRDLTTPQLNAFLSSLLHRLKASTASLYFGHLRQCLGGAHLEGLIATNPAAFRRRVHVDADEDEVWTYLDRDELARLVGCTAIPADERLLVELLARVGLRIGEFLKLRLEDLVTDGPTPHILVRRGGRRANRTKTKRARAVPLFGRALELARAWVERLPTFAPENPLQLAFPTKNGCERPRQRPFGYGRKRRSAWFDFLKAAGIMRRVRVHDLRHTAASWLVSGWMTGTPWRLEDVRDFLGHKTIAMTERYAHLAPSRLHELARQQDAMPRPMPRGAVSGAKTASKQGESTSRSSACARNPGNADGAGVYPLSWHERGIRALKLLAARDVAGVELGLEVLDELGRAIDRAREPGPFQARAIVEALALALGPSTSDTSTDEAAK